jgi:hypothetical protein
MGATPRNIETSPEDLGGGAYSILEVPAWYTARLTDVQDYETSRSTGWVWFFDIEGLQFRTWTSFGKSARWKLVEVIDAFDPGGIDKNGLSNIDPNLYIGLSVKALVDFQKPPEEVEEGDTNYREIKSLLPDIKVSSSPTAEGVVEENPPQL